MLSIGEALMNSLGGSVAKQYFETAAKKVEGLTPREMAQRRIDALNREHDYQDKTESDCKLCDNRGWTRSSASETGIFTNNAQNAGAWAADAPSGA